MLLSKDNIADYIKNRTNIFDNAADLLISEIGDGLPEDDGDGFINFVFRVSSATRSIIVKQARTKLRSNLNGHVLPVNRNKLEYESIKLRNSITPQYVPDLYHIDTENSVFIMEDISYLKILRFQLNKMNTFNNFPKQCAEYLAASNFYTSEIFLDTHTYRNIISAFANSKMREVMENATFVRHYFGENKDGINKELLLLSNDMWSDENVILEAHKLRDIFMKKYECLIHGDMHTSNIFVDENRMKVIDMEYTFVGPASFDMGYLIANFITQYAAASFKTHEDMRKTHEFKCYLLSSIKALYENYINFYDEYWEKDAKDKYKKIRGYKEHLYETLLHEMIGFSACPSITRITSFADFPDFDVIDNVKIRNHAKRLSLIISKHFLLNREKYYSIDDFIYKIAEIEQIYKKNMI
jgi:5-methylthioribose kinase